LLKFPEPSELGALCRYASRLRAGTGETLLASPGTECLRSRQASLIRSYGLIRGDDEEPGTGRADSVPVAHSLRNYFVTISHLGCITTLRVLRCPPGCRATPAHGPQGV
jgi:hypothetical protein